MSIVTMRCFAFVAALAVVRCDGEDKPPSQPGDSDTDTDTDDAPSDVDLERARVRFVNAVPDGGDLGLEVTASGAASEALFGATVSYGAVSATDSSPAGSDVQFMVTAATLSKTFTSPVATLKGNASYLVVAHGYFESANKPANGLDVGVFVVEETFEPSTFAARAIYVNAASDSGNLNMNLGVPFEPGTVVLGQTHPGDPASVSVRNSAIEVIAQYFPTIPAEARQTTMVLGSYSRVLSAPDGPALLIIPADGSAVTFLRSAPAVYLIAALPTVDPAHLRLPGLPDFDEVDVDPVAPNRQDFSFGSLSPRKFIRPFDAPADRFVEVLDGTTSSDIAELSYDYLEPGSTRLFLVAGLTSPSVGEEPITLFDLPIEFAAPAAGSVGITTVHAAPESGALTTTYSIGGFTSDSPALTFGNKDSASAASVPVGEADVAVDVTVTGGTSYAGSFTATPGAQYIVVAVGTTQGSLPNDFRLFVIRILPNNQIATPLVVAE